MNLDEMLADAVERAVDRHLASIRDGIAQLLRNQPPAMLTVAQAADALGCHPNTIRRMIDAGQLEYKRVGKAGLRINAASLHGAGGGDVGQRRAAGGRR